MDCYGILIDQYKALKCSRTWYPNSHKTCETSCPLWSASKAMLWMPPHLRLGEWQPKKGSFPSWCKNLGTPPPSRLIYYPLFWIVRSKVGTSWRSGSGAWEGWDLGRGTHQGIMPFNLPSKTIGFSREMCLCSLVLYCNSRKSAGLGNLL